MIAGLRIRAIALAAACAASLALVAPARAAVTATPVATNLEFPSMFTFGPDGRIYYGELSTGEIRVLDLSTGSNTLFFTIPGICTGSERGLFGVAVYPDPSHNMVYAYATRNISGTCRNQLLRIDTTSTGKTLRVLLTGPPAPGIHNGGRIMFGPDRNLYIATGDHANAGNAQNLGNVAGKVLRMTPWGTAPSNNPIQGNLIFGYGLRNVFGFDFDPRTGRLWATDNGPACNDEVDVVVAGRNHGWGPTATCSTPPAPPANTNRDGPSPVFPRTWNAQSQAPTGAAFCAGCGLGTASEGTFIYAVWETGEIKRQTLTSDRWHVASQVTLFNHRAAGPLSIEAAANGTLYLSDQSAIYRLVQTP